MQRSQTRYRNSLLAMLLCCCLETSYANEEKLTTLDDQSAVAVTIYNENLALIKDTRNIKLDSGFNKLAFRDVSARIRPETALLRSLDNAELNMLEQNFDYDLLTPAKLLEKYVGKKVKIGFLNPVTGIETIEEAEVLSTNSGTVVKIGDRIETNPRGRFIFDEVPQNLRDKPTLVLQLDSNRSEKQAVELSYLSGGLSWKADYVAELNQDDNRIDLLGWVTLNNQSGTTYNNARMQLVAGDVNQVKQNVGRMHKAMRMEMAVADAAAPMEEESLFEYHLYSLNRNTTIANNQSKQVSLLTAANVPVTKEFLLQGSDYYYRSSYGNIGQKIKIGVFVEFKNAEKNALGMPLPKGVVRVYKKDSKGNAQFVGEDNIDHTPKNEDVRLKLGDAFDITANKTQVDFKKRSAYGKYNYAFESAYEVEIKNAKDEMVEVVVREPVPGDWEMVDENLQHSKVASGTAEWRVSVPAEGKTVLKYRTLVRF